MAATVVAEAAGTAADVTVAAQALGLEASPTSRGGPATGTARVARPTTSVRLLLSKRQPSCAPLGSQSYPMLRAARCNRP